MNDKLLLSSIICGIIILSFKYTVLTLPIIITYIGIITSILNHGLTNKYYKWLDRLMMFIISIIYFSNTNDNKIKALVAITVSLYLLGKKYKNDNLHMISHILSVLMFYLIIKEKR